MTPLLFLVFALVSPLIAFHTKDTSECGRACDWCEHRGAPQLLDIARRCPKCECAVHFTNSSATCPKPRGPPRLCPQGHAHNRHGCRLPTCDSRPGLLGLHRLLRSCRKVCPGGFQVDLRTGEPRCACACPLENISPMQRTQGCARQCFGRAFSLLFDRESGCVECKCGPKLPKAGCLPLACPLACPLGFQLGPNGCRQCQCREPPNCPPAPKCDRPCLSGPRRDPVTGCVDSCDCEENEQMCPPVGCSSTCGPHRLRPLFDGKCQTGCRCECKVPTCPEDLDQRQCVEPDRDEFGCPTCGCKRFQEPPESGEEAVPLCRIPGQPFMPVCQLKCPSRMRMFNSRENCELCACCPDIWKSCTLKCDQFAADDFGCPICACDTNPEQLPSPKKPLPPPEPEVVIEKEPEEDDPEEQHERAPKEELREPQFEPLPDFLEQGEVQDGHKRRRGHDHEDFHDPLTEDN